MVEVVAAADPRGQCRDHPRVALPEPADVVAIAAVPVRPPSPAREAADLIQAGGVPRLGDQLGVRQKGVFRDRLDRRRLDQDIALTVSPQDRCEVESEAVDARLGHGVAEAREDQPADDRMVAVDGVAAAREVHVLALLVEHVVHGVVETAEMVRRAVVAPLGRVVEHDVEHDLHAVIVQGLHHPAELAERLRSLPVAGVRRLGRRVGDGVVAPEIAKLLARERIDERAVVLVELVDRQEFDGGDAEILEIRDLLDQPAKGAAVADARRLVDREAADVQLVDDGVLARDAGIDVVGPIVERAAQEAPPGDPARLAPRLPAGEGPRGRVDEDDARVVAVAVAPRAVDPVAVRELVGQAVDADVPVVAGPVVVRAQRDLDEDVGVAGLGDDEADRRRMPADHHEVHAIGCAARSQRDRVAAADGQRVPAKRISRRGGTGGVVQQRHRLEVSATDRPDYRVRV